MKREVAINKRSLSSSALLLQWGVLLAYHPERGRGVFLTLIIFRLLSLLRPSQTYQLAFLFIRLSASLAINITCTMTMFSVSALILATMILTSTVAENQLVKRASCSHGWAQYNGRCFRYISTPLSWVMAEKNCHLMGANLASVRDFAEYQMIQKVIQAATSKNPETWIGGSDAQQETHWLWSDGTPFVYTNWCCGEPNNSGGKQHCVVMNYSAKSCWDDLYCNFVRPFVCVKKM
ncbi:ladderlectin-like [Melanotaenia boesemani]|uniref:ladderlectin-like n=1 Tax=Melanotaenia boesemani TaxID=1250792 RepID=UPI001C0435B5|nr:ladderlectin-like [Melanotaenia boesemani]